MVKWSIYQGENTGNGNITASKYVKQKLRKLRGKKCSHNRRPEHSSFSNATSKQNKHQQRYRRYEQHNNSTPTQSVQWILHATTVEWYSLQVHMEYLPEFLENEMMRFDHRGNELEIHNKKDNKNIHKCLKIKYTLFNSP